MKKILLLGSGELGKELTISLKRLGCEVIACDSYDGAPAMQVTDECEVFSMLDGEALRAVIEKHQPDLIVPEIEAIRTEVLEEAEQDGYTVVPSARAVMMTMNRDSIRDLAANELGIRTSKFRYATTVYEALEAAHSIGYPCVMKPVMSSSGKGQCTIRGPECVEAAWTSAIENGRGDRLKVIIEEFIDFELEITLLTIRHKDGIRFLGPIGHRQELGDYRESWTPAGMLLEQLTAAQAMATKVVDNLGGYGVFGVEFFVTKDEVIFSELSPRPHDTGMVTMISHPLSQFDLHARAIVGLPLGHPYPFGPAASAVILADRDSHKFDIELGDVLTERTVDVRVFGKPVTRKNRRMGIALARGFSTDEARQRARDAAGQVTIVYNDDK